MGFEPTSPCGLPDFECVTRNTLYRKKRDFESICDKLIIAKNPVKSRALSNKAAKNPGIFELTGQPSKMASKSPKRNGFWKKGENWGENSSPLYDYC